MQIILVIHVKMMSLFKTDILKQYLYHNRANTAFTVFIFKCQTLGRNIISEIFTHFGQSATVYTDNLIYKYNYLYPPLCLGHPGKRRQLPYKMAALTSGPSH